MFIAYGAISAVGILFLLFKLDIRKVLYFDLVTDITATVALIIMFAGTFSGMLSAMTGGAIISVVLFFLKKTIGYKKPVVKIEDKQLKTYWEFIPAHK